MDRHKAVVTRHEHRNPRLEARQGPGAAHWNKVYSCANVSSHTDSLTLLFLVWICFVHTMPLQVCSTELAHMMAGLQQLDSRRCRPLSSCVKYTLHISELLTRILTADSLYSLVVFASSLYDDQPLVVACAQRDVSFRVGHFWRSPKRVPQKLLCSCSSKLSTKKWVHYLFETIKTQWRPKQ